MEKRPIERKVRPKSFSNSDSSKPRFSRNSGKPAAGNKSQSMNDRRAGAIDKRRVEQRRIRKFSEPEIPVGITGEELEKRDWYQLTGLAKENAEMVAKHLVAMAQFLLSGLPVDLERAYWHGQSASFRAGRLALVRERAGVAALKFGKYEVAQRELKAAFRISGSQSVLPHLAEAERALGNPRKGLETIGKVNLAKLSDADEVELRIVSAACRIDLGQADAAVVTLTCSQLNNKEALWSNRLRSAYEAALLAAGRK